jgi:hypothetical protein
MRTFGWARASAQHVGQQRFAEILLQAQPDPAFQFTPRKATAASSLSSSRRRAWPAAPRRLRQRQAPAVLAEQGHARLFLEFFQLR